MSQTIYKPQDELVISSCFHATNEILQISREMIETKSRKKEIIEAKRFICYYLRWHSNLNTIQIGKVLCGINHATVLHHCLLHQDLIDVEPKYSAKYAMFVAVASRYNQPKTLRSILNEVEYNIRTLLRERSEVKKMIRVYDGVG